MVALLRGRSAKSLLHQRRISAIGLDLGECTVHRFGQIRRVLAQRHAVFLGGQLLREHAQIWTRANELRRRRFAGHSRAGAANLDEVEHLLMFLYLNELHFGMVFAAGS